MPLATARTLPRRRVRTTLQDALAAHCLVVLAAPMGYGKTTAALELKEKTGKRFLYLPVKFGCRTIEYLWDDVCSRLIEQGADNARALRLMDFPNEEARLYRGLSVCRESLSAAPTLLVIDDYHHVTVPEFDHFIEALVREEIPEFNLLLLSRSKPALSLEYLQIKGHAAVLGPELLAFSTNETRRLFRMAGESDPQPADTAGDFSGGWAAALRLCLQSYLTSGVVRPVNDVEKLFTEAFFSVYDEADQRLLLQLSTLETFTGEQAAYLSNEASASYRLRKLYEHNTFLSHDPADDVYTMHGLFRMYLRDTLAGNTLPVCESIDRALLFRRAGECCFRSGDRLQALRLFAQAGRDEDLLRILQAFESPDEGVFITLDPEGVAAIVEDIPWAIRMQCPIGYLGFIHRYMVRVDSEKAAALFWEAERRFSGEDSFSWEMRDTIQGEMELVRAVRNFNDIHAMGRCYEKARRLLRRNSSLVNEDMFWTFNCPHSALQYLREPGAYTELVEVVSQKLPYFQDVSAGSNAGAVDLLKAEHLLETEGPHTAQHLLLKAEYKAESFKQYPVLMAVAFTKARMHLARGRADQALQTVQELYPPLTRLANPLLTHALDTCRGYIAAACGRLDAIPFWLLCDEPPRPLSSMRSPFTTLTRGKAIMALKEWTRLEAFAEETERKTAYLNSLFMRLHVLLFKAVAAMHTHLYNIARAESSLAKALELAEKDGIITSIAEYGIHLYPLLRRLENLHPHRKEYVTLSRLTKKYAALDVDRALRLTVRERFIMELVSSGACNRDIGTRLGISTGSVANALSRIYSKMGVGSRIEGIGKWSRESARYGDDSSELRQ